MMGLYEDVRVSKSNLAAYIFLVFVSFPYFSMGTTAVDTSLYALMVASILFCFYFKVKVSFSIFSLFLLAFFSILIACFLSEFNFLFLRTAAGYVSVFLVAFVTYVVLKNAKINHQRFFFRSSLIWCAVGLIQAFFFPGFLSFLVVRSTTTPNRGVTSLAPEPTYFATISFFLFLICVVNRYRIKKSILVLLISVFLLAQSSTVAAVLVLSSLAFIVLNIRFRSSKAIGLSVLVFSLLFVAGLFIFYFLEGTRINSLLVAAIHNPEVFVTLDGSVNARFWHLFAPFLSMFENLGLPQGYSGFESTLSSFLEKYPAYVHSYTIEFIGEKIQSGTGQLVYNMGIFGLLYFVAIFGLARKVLGVRQGLFLCLSLLFIMSTAVPISIPLFGFMFGYLAYKKNYELNEFGDSGKI